MQPEENKWLALPQAIHPPAIDPHLEELTAIPRATECLRHFVLSTEYWLSRMVGCVGGSKTNVALSIAVHPAIVLMPIIGLALHEVDGWLSMH